jgi:hypothetical protein
LPVGRVHSDVRWLRQAVGHRYAERSARSVEARMNDPGAAVVIGVVFVILALIGYAATMRKLR